MESKSAILFRHWIKANPMFSASFEMKDTKGKQYISFTEIKDHQLNYGMAIKGNNGVFIRVQGMNGEPDYIYLRNIPAFMAIKYPNSFELIDIETLVIEKKKTKHKSLSYARAKQLSTISIVIPT